MESPELERAPLAIEEAPTTIEVTPEITADVKVELPPTGEQLIPVVTKPDAWAKIVLKPRVDSFNQGDLLAEIKSAVEGGAKRIALDFSQNRFVSVAVIQACVQTAAKLRDEGGELALVGCSERGKRHFSVYGSMDNIRVVRTHADLELKRSARAS